MSGIKDSNVTRRSIQGVGVGLRTPHYHLIEEELPAVDWFEVQADNYLGKGGAPLFHLEQIRQHYPISFHSVGMSLGSSDPLNMEYLSRLRQLIRRFEPLLVSDHLCWTSIGGHYVHDLLPLPYLEQTARHVADRIRQVQDMLQRRILIENVSSYFNYQQSALTEWEFLNLVAELADCDILLDINNIYVSACNHGFDPCDYLNTVCSRKVRELHLAGYTDMQTYLLDTHSTAVHPPVWRLYQIALQRFGPIPSLIEWDNDIPAFAVLQQEAHKAERLMLEASHHVG